MEPFLELLKEVNIAQIIIILAGGWVFYKRLNTKIDKLDNKIEKLEEKVIDIDRRLCRIEGSLATQGHCLFHQTNTEKRAE
jgi:hypothetical protein